MHSFIQLPLSEAVKKYSDIIKRFPVYKLLRSPEKCVVRIDFNRKIVEFGPPPSGMWLLH